MIAESTPIDIRTEKLTLLARDGYPLGVNRYHAPGSALGNLLVAGVPVCPSVSIDASPSMPPAVVSM